MSNLKVKIGNIEFQNPFIVGSGPSSRNAEMISRAFEAGWGGAVTKTICLNYKDMLDVSPRFTAVENGFQNIELISPVSPQKWAEDIRELKKNYPYNILIASISAEANNLEGWKQLVLTMQNAGADIIELNFGCPHGLPEMSMGNTCSDNPNLAANIINTVKKVSQVPIWAKLSPNVSSIEHLAEICIKAGADGITAINTVKGFSGVDIETGLPRLCINENSSYGGFSGSMIKPISLKAVSGISLLDKSLPVSASGGIRNWEDSAEFILLGASTIQVCTEIMIKGLDIIIPLKAGLKEYLNKLNVESIDEIRGKSLKYIKSHSILDRSVIFFPEIDVLKCVKCGKCSKSCHDGAYQAIEVISSGIPEVNRKKCSGCGLCKIICPVGCIKMISFKRLRTD